jgi:hypothetical protein
MRNTLLALVAIVALSSPALAEPVDNNATAVELGAGAVTGTVVGLGVSEGWFGTTIGSTIVPATAATGAAVGGVAGVGAVAMIDAVVEPCQGFQALFGANKGACVDGHYVGYQPAPRRYVR